MGAARQGVAPFCFSGAGKTNKNESETNRKTNPKTKKNRDDKTPVPKTDAV